jgi:hypothetical protein
MTIRSLKSMIWSFTYVTFPHMRRRVLGYRRDLTIPDFLIIGTQRGGTTSLFRYLQLHPRIRLPIIKEIHYFDLQPHRSTNWYFAHFPLRHSTSYFITGEASPYYLFHPDVPGRVAALLPDIRLIVLLRDPVTRAYSHYQHNRKHQLESRTFEDAISAEMTVIQSGKRYTTDNTDLHRHYSYVARGIYTEQMSRWLEFFPREHLLCLNSTYLFQSPKQAVERCVSFLQLDVSELPQAQFLEYNQTKHDGQFNVMPQNIQTQLAEFYLPYNQQLAHQLNHDLTDWTGYKE